MFGDIWEHIAAAAVFAGKIIFWQWYKITTRLIDLDLRLTDIEKSLTVLRDEHDSRTVCQYQEELSSVKALLEKIAQREPRSL